MSCTGTCKWFDRKKGIGFVTPKEGGDDIFIHRRNFTGSFTLDEGDEIYYDVGEYEGRATAVKISTPIDKPPKEQRRRRGRNAKKELDGEAAADSEAAVAEAMNGEGDGAAAETGDAPRAGGGRDSKTHRRPVHIAAPSPIAGPLRLAPPSPILCLASLMHHIASCPLFLQYNRERRNDKGVGEKGAVDKGQASSNRNNRKKDTTNAVRESGDKSGGGD